MKYAIALIIFAISRFALLLCVDLILPFFKKKLFGSEVSYLRLFAMTSKWFCRKASPRANCCSPLYESVDDTFFFVREEWVSLNCDQVSIVLQIIGSFYVFQTYRMFCFVTFFDAASSFCAHAVDEESWRWRRARRGREARIQWELL